MAKPNNDDWRWMRAALALGERGVGQTTPNPSVGCLLVKDGVVVGRGWTQPGGRPHAEAMALAQAQDRARGTTLYTSLEPCAHTSVRGPNCSDSVIAAGVARVVCAMPDPDPRTHMQGYARLRAAGLVVEEGVCAQEARVLNLGLVMRHAHQRPAVTLKIATSLDGRMARPDGESVWITGEAARAHAHLERARHDAIVIGRGTLVRDNPKLSVRLPGLENRTPRPVVMSQTITHLDSQWHIAADPRTILWSGTPQSCLAHLHTQGVLWVMIEGGPHLASSWLASDVVDRLLWYRAPIIIGAGQGLSEIGLMSLAQAHDRWALSETHRLGLDQLDVYQRTRTE